MRGLNATQNFYFILVIVAVGALGRSAKPGTNTLKKVTEFDLPGPAGKRFDYLTIAADDHYLLSAPCRRANVRD
jgi:hypothetical protein